MDKKIIDLGTINGKVLLFGGVYSNLQALEGLIAIAQNEDIASENCFCTGDIIGYCAQPEETTQRFRNWGARSILGNVEQQLRSDALDCGCDFRAGSRCDGFSKEWYAFAKAQVSQESVNWMKTLADHITFTYAQKQLTLVHGSYDYISEFVFRSTPWEVKKATFDATQSEVIVAGHAGLPFYEKKAAKLWINPGVIGMPANEGKTRVWYAILDDTDEFSVSYHTYEYDYRTANNLMKANGLPLEYANTLVTGIWDNMEILPEQERALGEVSVF